MIALLVGEIKVYDFFVLRRALSAKNGPKLMSRNPKLTKSETDIYFFIPTVKVFQKRGDDFFLDSKKIDRRKFETNV